MIILHKGARKAQGSRDILPAGGAGDPAQCPHTPVTLHCRVCGGCRDALPGHYLCCCRGDKCDNALLHKDEGVITPAGPGARLGQGRPRPPPNHARAAMHAGGRGVAPPPPPPPLHPTPFRGAFRARRLAVHVWPAGFGGLELGSGAFDLRHERRCEVEGDYNNKKASATQPTTQKLHDD